LGQGTKDTDLMKASVQIQAIESRAESLANQFQMSVESARQLTQLADRMQTLTNVGQGQLSDGDREALTRAALGVAGISYDDVKNATAQIISGGNTTAVDDLMTKAATHLGMTSTATLRDQILPTLGISFPSK
jgi:hypothetical protein